MDGEFFFYLNIYENNKLFGVPYKNWTEMPEWMVWLAKTFAALEERHAAKARG